MIVNARIQPKTNLQYTIYNLTRQETADQLYKKPIAKDIKLFSKTENDKHSIRRMYARDSREGMNNRKPEQPLASP